jgi:hypothetical protein
MPLNQGPLYHPHRGGNVEDYGEFMLYKFEETIIKKYECKSNRKDVY